MIKDVYIAGGVRTPFGSFGGALSQMRAPELGSIVIREALTRAGVKAEDVDSVLFGNVIQAGIGQNVARQASLGAGIPERVGAATLNKVCGSGMLAVIGAAQAIQCGDAGVVVAGGCESMSNAPYMLRKARTGYRMGHGELIDSMIYDGLWDVYGDKHMGTCGDRCAAEFEFTREQQDAFAAESYRRAIESWENGFFKSTVTPVEVKTRKGSTMVETDEDLAKFRGAEGLAKLRPAFGRDGTVTAGNASGINDGAAAMVVFDDSRKASLGLEPAVRILGYANYATDPEHFTIAPIHAIRMLLDKVALRIDEVDLFEINEAFSVIAMAAMRELGIDHDKLNVAGGAVAIGHPLGASGARIINTLIRALELRNGRLGIASLCLGGGEALAIAVERCA